ncbi:MAG: MFS transporter [Pseudomonadales bacterium]
MKPTPRSLYIIATATWFFAFGLQSVVFAWLVTIVLHEPAQLVGWAQTAVLAPGMALILLAGALADRLGADRQALLAQLVAALAPWLLIAALNAGVLSYTVMVVYALLMGTAQAFVTPARDGLLSFVAGGQVQKTVLVTSLAQFSFQILGYWIAGFADRVGPSLILSVQSAVLLVGALAYVLISRADVVQRTVVTQSVLRGVVEGARTVMASPVMRVVVVQNIAMACFFMGCFIVAFPLVVREVFDGSSGDMATLYAFNSLGLVLTILVQLRVGHVRRPGRALLAFQILGAVVLAWAGLVDNFLLFTAAVFCWGLCGGIAMPMSRTLMQELAPPEQRSRVMSFYAFSFMGAGPIGTVLNGYLAALFGPQMTIVICGVAMATVALSMAVFSRLWHTESEVVAA